MILHAHSLLAVYYCNVYADSGESHSGHFLASHVLLTVHNKALSAQNKSADSAPNQSFQRNYAKVALAGKFRRKASSGGTETCQIEFTLHCSYIAAWLSFDSSGINTRLALTQRNMVSPLTKPGLYSLTNEQI